MTRDETNEAIEQYLSSHDDSCYARLYADGKLQLDGDFQIRHLLMIIAIAQEAK
jgi:hypothetical protein